jgi:aspartokinase
MFEYKTVLVETGLAKISIVGAQLSSSYEVGVIQALTRAGIQISLVSTYDTQLSVMISEKAVEEAVALTHENYCPLELAC